MSQPRYAPRRARLKLSLTRTVTSAAALAALAMVCGPALDPSSDRAEAAAAVDLPGPIESDSAADPSAPAPWSGSLQIRPSRIAKALPTRGEASPLSAEAVTLGPAGTTGALGIPLMVLRAYHLAADQLQVEQPSCKLPWWLLAGIGRTESGHAESGRLIADGTTRGRILGPRLNGGIVGDAIITDTDKGRHDGDTVYDRAVGPMQFIPTTWARWGADGNADGKSDPNNIFDATLAAGRYLCAHDRDLATAPGLRAAVLSYNYSAPYLATVLAWGTAYRDGASALPNSPLPVISDVTKVRPPHSSRPPKPTAKPSKQPSTAPASSSQPGPSASASSSAAASSSATATASPTASSSASCPSASPTPTDSESSSSNPATPQSQTAKPAATSTRAGGSATATATPSGSATASGSTTASGSGVQSATGQSVTSGSLPSGSSSAGSTSASATASPSLSDCAP